MRKYHLLAPGPTPVPPQVLEAMARPLVHHRTKDFEALFAEVRSGLAWLHQDEGDVIILASSGTGGMEAAVANLLSPGEGALVVEGGKFGERWTEICRAYGVAAEVLRVEPGYSLRLDELESRLDPSRHKAVFVQASETSTGAKHDVQALGGLLKKKAPDTLLAVDAITALGVYDIRPAEWGIDVLVGGSQKALMLPPGLATLWLSGRAWAAAAKSRSPRYYFDLRIERKVQAKNTTAWTPAISLIVGLRVALEMMRQEGLEGIFKRHAKLAAGTQAAVEALGLEIFPRDLRSESVTAVRVPEGVNGKAIPDRMQDTYGVTIAGGQGELAGKIFRIGHLGYVDESDVLTAVGALENVLADLGRRVDRGAGVAAAQEALLR
ncbi:MAG: alanine--glyoxylate aminotransferase family protein [Candidatus Tectomicrobia bacterium]|nr:alanine--glyoxylate aminotransferase family protein [Candidatus Tectomicrobia bacterium]